MFHIAETTETDIHCNFLGYYSVISAIPVEWKNVCKEPPKKMLITKRKLA